MNRGRFIAFEGGEGAGKSTQARMLAESLMHRGIKTILTREPGGTPGAEAIRDLLLRVDGEGWNPRAEALLFAAARSDHVERLIRPALAEGKWVICDRFLDSSRAYQGGGSGLSDADILALHKIGSQGMLPDKTLLIEVSPANVASRLAERDRDGTDRIGGRDAAFHTKVSRAFSIIANSEPRRYAIIDGNGTPEATHRQVVEAIEPLLESRS